MNPGLLVAIILTWVHFYKQLLHRENLVLTVIVILLLGQQIFAVYRYRFTRMIALAPAQNDVEATRTAEIYASIELFITALAVFMPCLRQWWRSRDWISHQWTWDFLSQPSLLFKRRIRVYPNLRGFISPEWFENILKKAREERRQEAIQEYERRRMNGQLSLRERTRDFLRYRGGKHIWGLLEKIALKLKPRNIDPITVTAQELVDLERRHHLTRIEREFIENELHRTRMEQENYHDAALGLEVKPTSIV